MLYSSYYSRGKKNWIIGFVGTILMDLLKVYDYISLCHNRHKERTKTSSLVSAVSEFFKEQSSFVNYLIFLFIKQSHICKFLEVNK